MKGLRIFRKLALCVGLCVLGLQAIETLATAMPAQVMIIRHAEKFEDRQNPRLSARGLTRAVALSQFFQSDPRVLKHGVVSAIIAQQPADSKESVRCVETVQPLAKALGQNVLTGFLYGDRKGMVEWIKSARELDNKSVLISAWHLDIVPLAEEFGVSNIRQSVWPHETYDRVWILDFSPTDGKLESFQDIPQSLLFGDSFQSASGELKSGSIQFTQIYSEGSNGMGTTEGPSANWKCRITAQIPGDFSEFDDETIPMLRLGGFTFGYHATSLGKLKQNPNAAVETDPEKGSGSLRYYYKSKVNGDERTYAWVSFTWDKEWLRIEFDAAVDESKTKPELDMPVECHMERVHGTVDGVANCYVAFGKQRFHAPAGLSYSGVASSFKDASHREIYNISLRDDNGFLIRKVYLPEL